MAQAKVAKTRSRIGGRAVGTPNKSTAKAREAIAAFVDGNAHQLQTWLDRLLWMIGMARKRRLIVSWL